MRNIIVAAAATAALASATFLADAKPVAAQSLSAKGPLVALQDGDLQTSYAQYRDRAYYGGGWRGRPAYVGGPYYGRPYYARPYYGRPYYYGRRYNYGGAAAAGAVGLATGAIIGSAIAQQQAAPVYAAPNNAAAYCAQRFRSYNPATGTYRGYDGRLHACP